MKISDFLFVYLEVSECEKYYVSFDPANEILAPTCFTAVFLLDYSMSDPSP